MQLIRDEVPAILRRQGLNPIYKAVHVHDHARYDLIRDKLLEVSGEAAIAIKSGNPEEVLSKLASLMEVMGTAASQYRLNLNDVKIERDRKRKVKGSYAQFYVLINPHRPHN